MQSRTLLVCTLLAVLAPLAQASNTTEVKTGAISQDAYAEEIKAWHASRISRLTAPESWLSLIGLEWLKEGPNTVGSATDNAVHIAKLPPHFGVFELKAGQVSATLQAGTVATLNGTPAPASLQLKDNKSGGTPDTLRCGSMTLVIIRRGEKIGIRIRDTQSPQRLQFSGIETFPVDPSWRIEADWIPFNPSKKISITNVIGQVEQEDAPGKAVFQREGKTYELIPTQDEPGAELFFVLRDLTSGHETYGASRFLVADVPANGKVLLDFNKLYNPPCAFTDFATCPLPIPENRLKLRITAGEQSYKGPGSHAE